MGKKIQEASNYLAFNMAQTDLRRMRSESPFPAHFEH